MIFHNFIDFADFHGLEPVHIIYNPRIRDQNPVRIIYNPRIRDQN